MILDEVLAKEINERKRMLIQEDKDHPFNIHAYYERHAQSAASWHSSRIELENSPADAANKESELEIEKGAKHILDAIIWASKPDNFKPGYINKEYVCTIAGKIDPILFNNIIADYRRITYGVRI